MNIFTVTEKIWVLEEKNWKNNVTREDWNDTGIGFLIMTSVQWETKIKTDRRKKEKYDFFVWTSTERAEKI